GCVAPDRAFLAGLRAVADRTGALLLLDEVITGFRAARSGAQGLFGVRPDISCFGKIIGGGLPVGAYAGSRELMSLVAPLGPVYQAGTLSGTRQIPELAARWRVRGVNPRGVGLSDAPDADAYEVGTAAADVATLLDTPAHVIGASLGAAVAVELALARPALVRSLTLITPFVEADARLLAVIDAWCRVASPEAVARLVLPWTFSAEYLADEG